MDLAKQQGYSHYRYAFEIGWGIEALDYIIAGCQSRGLKLLLCVFRNDRILPVDQAACDSYAASLVSYIARGVGTITHVEFWNEPNLTTFSTTRDATQWARMCVTAHAAVKAAYPTVKTITGGLSPAAGAYQPNTWFLAACAANASLKTSFDMIGIHPYDFPHSPMSNYSWCVNKQVVDLKNSMVSLYGVNPTFAATEYGAPSSYTVTQWDGTHVFDEAKQAEWMGYYKTAFDTRGATWGLESVFMVRDGAIGGTWEPSTGMFRADNTAKPAAAVRVTS
jgi:hypothetical protein